MHVREVIPFGKSDEEMETREREKSRTVEKEGGRPTEVETVSEARSLRVIGCLSFVFSICQKVASSHILP